ncbi:MAG: bifunctional riboflavin kinase/FAD synthetase [Bacteroidales bacterium]|nr:bifunctional riboflavin kinase/FAD synthetase [Bacteroidales bacterium]
MKVYRSIKEFNVKNPVLTVGTFDGVHLGHKKIIEKLIMGAKQIQGESVILTLHPHPRKVLFPDRNGFGLLNTLEEKIKLLENAGLKHLIIYPFTKEFAALSSCDFIEKILYNKLKIKQLIVGHDHHFGKDRQGNLEILRNCANQFGTDVVKVEALLQNNQKISSTKIRNALLSGDTLTANSYLGYNYFLSGEVISGNKIGRTLGFPTANIQTEQDKLIPKTGVYAVKVIVDNVEYKGMSNIGSKPTVSSKPETGTEVHIFDFNENLYGSTIEVQLVNYIRKERKFKDKKALKKQLSHDKKAAFSLLI